MEETEALETRATTPKAVDWALVGGRIVLAVGLILFNRLAPIEPAQQSTVEYLLASYLALTAFEALFLWQGWGRGGWPHVTLLLDIILIVILSFLTGKITSPLLPLLLLPVAAISLRLGLAAGMGLNVAAISGYIVLASAAYFVPGSRPDLHQSLLFGASILMVAILGGVMAERMVEPAREELGRYQEQMDQLRSQCTAANKRARVFYEMSHTLNVTMSYQKVLEGVLQDCKQMLDFTVGVVLLTAGQEDLFVAASSGLRVGDAGRQVHLQGGELSTSLATANPVLLERLGRDAELSQVTALQRCRSGMCMPLRAGMRNYGAIILGSINEDAYSQVDLSQLAALAHFATIAIQNAQLYQDLREERDKIIRAEENVRKELSRDLHDGPAQSLAAMAMSAEYIKRLLANDPSQATKELDELEQLARKTAWDVRTMLFELRPIILETQGLVPTLEQYVQRFPSTDVPQVHLDTGGFSKRVVPKAETTIFTIMQEAVNNARKHAKANHIWMRLAEQNGNLVASVQDDGAGFDLEAVKASYERRGSFGLLNMQERAQLIGGRTEIRSAPGQGTAIIITVPLQQE